MSEANRVGGATPLGAAPPYVYRLPMRWGDLDAQGHVNNSVLVDYLQQARVWFLLDSPIAQLLETGVLVVSHQVEYRAKLQWGPDPVRIELWVDQVGGSRFAVSYRLYDHDLLILQARTVIATYDLIGQKLRRLTSTEREWLRTRLAPAVELRQIEFAALGPDPLVVPCQARWSDHDSYGHVNNFLTWTYIQEARITALGAAWEASMLLVARQDVNYHLPMIHTGDYQIRVSRTQVGRTSFQLASEIRDRTDALYATAHSVLVTADQLGRPIEIPTEVRARLQQL